MTGENRADEKRQQSCTGCAHKCMNTSIIMCKIVQDKLYSLRRLTFVHRRTRDYTVLIYLEQCYYMLS